MALLLLAAMATVVMGQVPPCLEERADQRVGSLPARTCLGYGVAFVELLRRGTIPDQSRGTMEPTKVSVPLPAQNTSLPAAVSRSKSKMGGVV